MRILYVREVEIRRLVEPFREAVRRLRANDGLLCGESLAADDDGDIPNGLLTALGSSLRDGSAEIVVMADPWPYDENGELSPATVGRAT